MNNIDFNISELADGAVQEKIDQEVRKIVDNINGYHYTRKEVIDEYPWEEQTHDH